MKKKIFLSLVLTLFFVISLTLSLGMFVFGESKPAGNEILSAAPSITKDDGSFNEMFLSDLSKWVNDRFFLRQEMITLDNGVTALLGVSGEKKVVVGRDGWLFFGDTVDGYTGMATLSERELFSVYKNIELMNEYCLSSGRDFSFVIAPNKNSLYGEYMPDYGVKAETTDAEKLIEMLKSAGIKSPDLFKAIGEKDEALYFKHDSHWNSKGAALGADIINNAFGVKTNFFEGDFSVALRNTGDLYGMIYPALTDTEIDWRLEDERDFEFTGSGKTPTSITITTKSDREGKLLAYRDSFGSLLFPYLAESYGECHFSRKTAYDLTLESDYVMVELVERNLSYLLKFAPIFPSPEREFSVPEASSGKVALSTEDLTAPEGLKAVKGYLPQCDSASGVYVSTDKAVYEALLTDKNGFVAYIPESEEPQSAVFFVGEKAVRQDF